MPNHKTKKPTERAKLSNTSRSTQTTNKSSKSISVSNSSYTPKSSLPSKTLKLIKKHKIISALLLILLIWLTYTQTMNYLEKRKYLHQYSQLEDYANQISQTYLPTKRTSEKSCSYQSAKWGHGDLYCLVDVTLEYENYSADKANQLMKEVSLSAGSGEIKSYSLQKNDKKSFIDTDNARHFYQDINGLDSSCSIGYTYNGDNYKDSEYDKLEEKKLYTVSLGCSSVTRAEHFPVKKP